jgi:hypothetical protein
MVYPPSIGGDTPVIIAASPLSRKATGAAISAGLAYRPNGMAKSRGSAISGLAQYPSAMGVMTAVGFTALTLMPCGPSSSAAVLVMLSTAA